METTETKSAFPLVMPGHRYKDGSSEQPTVIARGLSELDYACIHLQIPKSGKPWLDELILEKQRLNLAAQVMSGVITSKNMITEGFIQASLGEAYQVADGLISRTK